MKINKNIAIKKIKITDESISKYKKYKLHKMSGVNYQTLTDIAIQQLYERVVREGKISFTVVREVNIDLKK